MKPKTLTFNQIKQLFYKKDIKFVDIASALNVTPPIVTQVAKGKQTSKRVATAIANALSLPTNQVFGTKYDKNNKTGPTDRTLRKAEIATALVNGQYVPAPNNHTGESA
jgi:transcriptional regulator with XRE-family HTH domain